MSDTIEPLILDLVAWIAKEPRDAFPFGKKQTCAASSRASWVPAAWRWCASPTPAALSWNAADIGGRATRRKCRPILED